MVQDSLENIKINGINKTMSDTLLVGIVTISLVWFTKYHWNRRRLYRIASKLNGPTPLPFIGNALSFMGSNKKILNTAMKMMEKYGGEAPIPIWFGQRLFFGITDPGLLETLLNSPHALEKEELYKFSRTAVGEGLFTAPVEKWKRHRKIIMPTFNQKILNDFVEIFSEQAVILTGQLKKCAGKGIFDVFDYFSRFSLDSICETAMGLSVNAQTTDSEFAKWANKVMEVSFTRMFIIWYHFDFIFNWTSMAKEDLHCRTQLKLFTGSVVRQKRQEYQEKLQSNNQEAESYFEDSYALRKKNTFLQQLIELSEKGEYLTDEEIQEEVLTTLIAGSETTASVNSFVLMMLGMLPNIQEKVYEEVIDAIGLERPVECKDLPKLYYTEMVIKETMRIFPIGPMIVRATTGDIRLGEHVIPSGCSVVLCIIHAHRDPKYWPNPLKFDPLRFLPEECTKRHPFSYLPFSGGPRNCIGLKYAMMAMKVVIASVIRKYHVKTNYKRIEDIRLKADLVLKPVDGYGISLECRE